jgi:hypothetical protein
MRGANSQPEPLPIASRFMTKIVAERESDHPAFAIARQWPQSRRKPGDSLFDLSGHVRLYPLLIAHQVWVARFVQWPAKSAS